MPPSRKRDHNAYNEYVAWRPSQSSLGHSSSQHASSSPSRQAHHLPKRPCANSLSGSSQQHPVIIDDDDEQEEEDGSQEAPDASQDDRQFSYVHYGTLEAKIVGCRFYSGYATEGEMAFARREPHNPYDGNAIQVLNVQNTQIGHIPRGPASKLAPYMDRRDLFVEALISGEKGYYECPVSLRLYGTNEPIAQARLIERMKADRLPVTNVSALQREEQKRRKIAEQAAKQARKKGGAIVSSSQGRQYENDLGEYAAASSSQGNGPGPTLHDIIGGSERFNPRNAEQLVEEFGVKESDLAAMPKASQPNAIVTQLHDFQLQGLQWLLDKETPQLPGEGSKDIVQLWRRHSHMRNVFTNVATKFSTQNPVMTSGGILADDMGLGKTIQVISLIMADRELGLRTADAADATLILAPVSVMSNWSTQIIAHIKPEHALRVMFYHGIRKQTITPKSVKDFDVVISTFDSVSSEYYSAKKPSNLPRASGVFSIKWRRVILDEAHGIRNSKAKKSIAVTNLMAQSRWALTGTPIVNNLKDLYSIARFLRLSGGLDSLEIFHGAIIRPVLQGSAHGNQSLQMLMAGLCLRRKKEMSFIDLHIPEIFEYVHKVTLFPHEQEKYEMLDAQAKGTLDLYRNHVGGKDSANIYRNLLEILLRMRQVCNHWKLVGEDRLRSLMKQLEAQGAVDVADDANKIGLQQILQILVDSQEECPVCMDTLKEPVITRCAHAFCTSCIERVIEMQHRCPMCRTQLDSLATTTVKLAKEIAAPAQPPTHEQIADKKSMEKERSSKLTALLSILTASAKDPSNKTVIFSQWTSFLDILQPHLKSAGFEYTRIDGSMSAVQRDAALQMFDTSPECTILLASLAVCSVGLNLVAANQVIMSDSWWAPAIEDQAVDRVHRLGQKRETKVFRLVVEGSIEERVLGIQEDKRKLMSLAFADKHNAHKKKRATGIADLARLLGTQNGSATTVPPTAQGE